MSERATIQFGRVPTEVIGSGAFSGLTPATAAVYLCLCSWNNADWQSSLGQRRIASLMGLHVDTVNLAIQSLREAGLIEHHQPGNGKRAIYTIITERTCESERSTCKPLGSTPPTVRIEASDRSVKSEHVQNVQINQTTASEFSFPLRGRGEWNLPADRLAAYRDAFPGLDIPGELRKARLWLIDNPDRRKTARGMPRFLSGWLTRAKPDTPAHGQRRTTSDELDAICPLVEPSEEDFQAAYGDLTQ